MSRVIRDRQGEPYAEPDRVNTQAILAAEQARLLRVHRRGGRALGPYGPRDLMAGDPASPGGTKVTCDELHPSVFEDCLAPTPGGSGVRVREVDGSPDIDPTTIITVPNDTLSVGAPGEAVLDFNAFELREVFLEFSASVAPGTAINIQTGVYAGAGSPATVRGDTNVTLPASGAAFADDGRIEITLNGQELEKGAGIGLQEAQWVSSTQIAFSIRISPGNVVAVKAPFPTA
jgi:hypothetical protein